MSFHVFVSGRSWLGTEGTKMLPPEKEFTKEVTKILSPKKEVTMEVTQMSPGTLLNEPCSLKFTLNPGS